MTSVAHHSYFSICQDAAQLQFRSAFSKFNGRIIHACSDEFPKEGKLCDLITRITTIVTAPIFILSLGPLALIEAVTCSFWCRRSVKKGHHEPKLQYREICPPDEKGKTETFLAIKDTVKEVFSDNEMKSWLKKCPDLKEELENDRNNPPSLFLDDEKKEYQVHKELGKGGCKIAYLLSSGKALILPNMTVDPIEEVQERWARIVEEEYQMSLFLQEIGLLGCHLEKVKVFPSTTEDDSIPAYTAKSFQELEEEGIFILDRKNDESSTWDKSHKLFTDIHDAENLENWDSIIDPFLDDIAKILYYQLPARGDSLNIAVIDQDGELKIRYFGFDFTNKGGPLSIPVIDTKAPHKVIFNKGALKSRIQTAITCAIESCLINEYEVEFAIPDEMNLIIEGLKERYTQSVIDRFNCLNSPE